MDLLTNFAKGAAAGLAGAAAMHAFRIGWERIAPDRVRDGIFGFDREADIDSAEWIHGLLLCERLPTESAARLDLALHYVYGALLGSACASARGRAPRISNACATTIEDILRRW